MMKILIATHNNGKLVMFENLFRNKGFEVVSLRDLGITHNVDETGTTYAENATLKAEAYMKLSGLPTIADDTGLEVDALGGEPGVYSARYAGENTNDAQKIAFLLNKLQNVPQNEWHATFRSVIALALPNKPLELFHGSVRGILLPTPRGTKNFGYCPIFLIPELGKTFGEIDIDETCWFNHRVQASIKLVDRLQELKSLLTN